MDDRSTKSDYFSFRKLFISTFHYLKESQDATSHLQYHALLEYAIL